MSWEPLLTTQQQRAIRPLLDDLLAATSIDAARANVRHGRVDVTLASGAPGMALFHHYYAAAYPDAAGNADVSGLIQIALSQLATSAPAPWLYGGYAGLGWVVAHLQRSQFLGDSAVAEIDLTAIDDLIQAELSCTPWPHDYDLIQGAVGLGVYGLERTASIMGQNIVHACVDRLYETADRLPPGIAWYHAPDQLNVEVVTDFPRGWYNLGVAHGNAGAIAFLARAVHANINKAKAVALLREAAEWVRTMVRYDDRSAWLPNYVDPEPNQNAPSRSRVAWCYGAPGAAVSLLSAASALNDQSLVGLALDLASAASSEPRTSATVADGSLCHGAAGLSHLFSRLYSATHDVAYHQAAIDWYERTLELRVENAGVCGFRYLTMPDGVAVWRAEGGFLEGAAGIGLALLGLATAVEPGWDRVLLADLPGILPTDTAKPETTECDLVTFHSAVEQ